jgi:hypothetical protein
MSIRLEHCCSDGDDFQAYNQVIFVISVELGREYDIDELILKLARTFSTHSKDFF